MFKVSFLKLKYTKRFNKTRQQKNSLTFTIVKQFIKKLEIIKSRVQFKFETFTLKMLWRI